MASPMVASSNAAVMSGIGSFSGYQPGSSSPYGYPAASSTSRDYNSSALQSTSLRGFPQTGVFSGRGGRTEHSAAGDLLTSSAYDTNATYPSSLSLTTSSLPAPSSSSLPAIGQASSQYGPHHQHSPINSQPQPSSHEHYSPQSAPPLPPPPPPPALHSSSGSYFSSYSTSSQMSPTPTTSSMISRPASAGNYPPPLMPLQPQPQYRPLQLPGMGMPMLNMSQPGGMLTHHPHGLHHHHPQQDRPFKCDQCTQSFSRNHDLKRHKRIHLAVKPFPCDNCDKSFSRKDALKRHRLVKGCGKASEARKAAQAAAAGTVSQQSSEPDSLRHAQAEQRPSPNNGRITMPSLNPTSPCDRIAPVQSS